MALADRVFMSRINEIELSDYMDARFPHKPRISLKQAHKTFAQLCEEIGDTPLVRHHKAIIAATDCKQCATRKAEVALQAWLTKNGKTV